MVEDSRIVELYWVRSDSAIKLLSHLEREGVICDN